jgi:hypothetical protein
VFRGEVFIQDHLTTLLAQPSRTHYDISLAVTSDPLSSAIKGADFNYHFAALALL